MMRIGVIALFMLAACGGTEIKQHGGYKSPKARPWEKPKALKLEKNTAKAEADLDYQRYKRAKWFLVETPGSGALDVQMEVTPGGPGGGGGDDEESEEQDMDVALEIIDGESFNVLAKSDLEAEDAHELKKQRVLKDLPEGKYLIHVYLQGRVDTADVDLKVSFTRGDLPWKSDFPNQVAFVDDLAAVPPLDDSPEPVVVKKKKVTRVRTTTTTTTTTKPDPKPTGFSVQAEISDVQPSGSGSIITIAGGTSDGLNNGYAGSIKGVRGSSFKLSGCGPSTCRATVKAAPEDVRGASGVLIKLK
jgi:hypothetical protein